MFKNKLGMFVVMSLQLPTAIGTAGVRAALDADHATGQIDQDGCEDRALRAVRDIPDGRGGGVHKHVRRHSGSHPSLGGQRTSGASDRSR